MKCFTNKITHTDDKINDNYCSDINFYKVYTLNCLSDSLRSDLFDSDIDNKNIGLLFDIDATVEEGMFLI